LAQRFLSEDCTVRKRCVTIAVAGCRWAAYVRRHVCRQPQ